MIQLQFVKTIESALKVMQSNGMSVKDLESARIVSKYDEMVKTGEQKGYIIQKLSDEFGVSVRSIYSAIERLHREVKIS